MNTKINKSDIILLITFFIVSFAIQGYYYYERDAMLREYLIDFPLRVIITCSTIYYFTFFLIPRVVESKRFIVFILLALLSIFVLSSIEYTIGFWTGDNDINKFPKGLSFFVLMINRGTMNMAFPFALLLSKKFYEGQNEYLKIEKQQKENELKLLRSQLDPHFLFNNLNTLDALIDTNPTKAKEYVNKLALIYRYLIQTKDSEIMELSDELNLAENYIFLIKTRFGNDYHFTIDNQYPLEDKFIPTGALQTILENIVKHNKAWNGNIVKANIFVEEDYIIISNTKYATTSNLMSLGTGLDNLRSRYGLLSDQNIKIDDNDETYSITIPIIKLSTES